MALTTMHPVWDGQLATSRFEQAWTLPVHVEFQKQKICWSQVVWLVNVEQTGGVPVQAVPFHVQPYTVHVDCPELVQVEHTGALPVHEPPNVQPALSHSGWLKEREEQGCAVPEQSFPGWIPPPREYMPAALLSVELTQAKICWQFLLVHVCACPRTASLKTLALSRQFTLSTVTPQASSEEV